MKLPFEVDLTGRTVVVTGAGGVLCSSFSKVLAQCGAKVALLDINKEAAKKYTDEKLPAVELVRRAVYGKIGRFTKSDIMELCPTIGKTSVESSIKALVDSGALMKHGFGPATFYTRSDAQ